MISFKFNFFHIKKNYYLIISGGGEDNIMQSYKKKSPLKCGTQRSQIVRIFFFYTKLKIKI